MVCDCLCTLCETAGGAVCVGGVRQWPVTVFVHCVRLLVELCVLVESDSGL